MGYLVDGNNLIGYAAQHGRPELASRRTLVAAIGALARRKGGRYTVVLDGGPDDFFVSDVDLGKVRVELAGSRSADGRILARLRNSPNPRNWTVVTSDRSLGNAARQMGARVLECAAFVGRLTGGPGGEGDEKRESGKVDLSFWEDYFKGRPPESDSDTDADPDTGADAG